MTWPHLGPGGVYFSVRSEVFDPGTVGLTAVCLMLLINNYFYNNIRSTKSLCTSTRRGKRGWLSVKNTSVGTTGPTPPGGGGGGGGSSLSSSSRLPPAPPHRRRRRRYRRLKCSASALRRATSCERFASARVIACRSDSCDHDRDSPPPFPYEDQLINASPGACSAHGGDGL